MSEPVKFRAIGEPSVSNPRITVYKIQMQTSVFGVKGWRTVEWAFGPHELNEKLELVSRRYAKPKDITYYDKNGNPINSEGPKTLLG